MRGRAYAVFLIILFTGAPTGDAQDKPTTEDRKKAEEREKKAEELYAAGKRHMGEEKFREAQTKLRLLRDRYRITKTYLENHEDIAERLLECGSRIAVDELRGQRFSRKAHVDAWHGIQFHPPQGWRGVPPFQQYFGDMDSSEVNYSGQNIRIARYTSPFLENLYLQVFKLYDTKSLEQLQDKVLQDLGKRHKGVKETSSETLKGKYGVALKKTFTDNDGNRILVYYYYGHRKGFSLVGVWRTQAERTFILTSSSGARLKKREVKEADWKEAVRVFDQTAKSFWLMPSNVHSAVKRRHGTQNQIPGWKILRTPNYVIEYATRDDYAKTLSKHMEKIFFYYRKAIPTGKGIPKCRIKLFDTEEDFLYYSNAGGAAAYWSPAQEEMVAYRFSGKKLKHHDQEMTVAETRNPEEETFHVMYHEGFHQYMYYLMGRARGVYVPSWLNEGMGDFFFGGSWVKENGKLKLRIAPNWWRLDTIHQAVKENKHVPLKQIFRYTQSQYYANAGLCYAQGWAICYFFLTSDVAKKKGYNTIPQQMLKGLQTSGNWEKTTDKVFAAYDLDEMERAWKAFVLSLKNN